jgi:hypothetical protein
LKIRSSVMIVAAAAALTSCATLETLASVQAPTFQVAGDRQAQLLLGGPSLDQPLGSARIRLWARINNPNAMAVTLRALNGELFLEGQRATAVDFPLGLPIPAARDTVIPFDIVVGFADIPNLVPVLTQAVGRGTADYRLDGRLQVDAGMLGQPVFGPMTFLEGAVPVLR